MKVVKQTAHCCLKPRNPGQRMPPGNRQRAERVATWKASHSLTENQRRAVPPQE